MARMTSAVALLVGLCTAAGGQVVAPVSVVAAVQQEMIESVQAYGIVTSAPAGNAAIAAAVPMRIEALLVGPGDTVTPGQLLVRLQRDRSLDLALEKARIQLQQAQTQLDRSQRLFAGGVIAKAQLEQAQVEQELAQAQMELEQRTLRYAIDNSEIRAPIRGVVSSVSGGLGQIADPAQEILHLIDPGQMMARVGVEIEDAGVVAVGQAAAVVVPNLPRDRTFHGRVARLERQIDPASQLVYLWIDLDNGAGQLQPGMFAEARVTVRRVPDAVTVPLSAVLADEEGAFLFVVADSTAAQVRVETGLRTSTTVQIVAGVQPGQMVVSEGNYELEDGMQVKAQARR